MIPMPAIVAPGPPNAHASENGLRQGSERVIIEWHTHVYPPEEAGDQPTWDGKSGPGWAGRCPMTVENVLDAHHKANIDISVVSNAAHYMRGKAEQDELTAIRRWSDYAAEIQNKYPGTLYGLA